MSTVTQPGRLYLSPLIFAALGPPFGMLSMTLPNGLPRDFKALLDALAIAYLVFVVPALAAGCLHALLGHFCLLLAKLDRVSRHLGFALGAVSGATGILICTWIWYPQLFAGWPASASAGNRFLAAGTFAGALCGLVTSFRSDASSDAPSSRVPGTTAEEPLIALRGRCPNCIALIALDSADCPYCKAEFGKNAIWRPMPLATEESLGRVKNA